MQVISEVDESNAEDTSEAPTTQAPLAVGQLTRFRVTQSNFTRQEEHPRFSKDDSDIRGPSLYQKRSLEREETTPKVSPILKPSSLVKSPVPEALMAIRRVEAAAAEEQK